MAELFSQSDGRAEVPPPLAERMRPRTLEEIEGQQALTGDGAVLHRIWSGAPVPSLVLWGPPGCGKTTIARLIASVVKGRFVATSAVLCGVKELRETMEQAAADRRKGKSTVLFVDEVHRFNKSQQDAFLPYVEAGDVVFIGATTENPSFEVNKALLSRVTVLRLEPLTDQGVLAVLKRALAEPRPRGLGRSFPEKAMKALAAACSGDARRALNILEQLAWVFPGAAREPQVMKELRRLLAESPFVYDKSGDQHYDLISAFIKSLRGSDPDAAMYWMCRMLQAGEDPVFIARRMLVFASEDVGNADPQGLLVAQAVFHAVTVIGPPECFINLAQGVTYLATAPKSNASYVALQECQALAREAAAAPVPMHLRNAPTKLMKEIGAGKGYLYPHDFPGATVKQRYLPDGLAPAPAYRPLPYGYEKKIREIMAWREKKNEEPGEGQG